jgi:hypothetical protein
MIIGHCVMLISVHRIIVVRRQFTPWRKMAKIQGFSWKIYFSGARGDVPWLLTACMSAMPHPGSIFSPRCAAGQHDKLNDNRKGNMRIANLKRWNTRDLKHVRCANSVELYRWCVTYIAQQEVREKWAHRCKSNGLLGVMGSLE